MLFAVVITPSRGRVRHLIAFRRATLTVGAIGRGAILIVLPFLTGFVDRRSTGLGHLVGVVVEHALAKL